MSRSPFKIQLAAVVCFLLVVAAGLLWYESVGPGYYAELNAIRGELQRIPQVEILELSGVDNDDFPLLRSLDHIRARIEIAGKVEMVFSGLSKESFRDTKQLHLVSVGPYHIRIRGEGYVGVYEAATGTAVRSEFGGGPVNIAPDGDFAHLFPFEIPNIQTAVAHYEDILRIIAAWPETPSQPRHFRDALGTDFYYWVFKKGIDEHDPLWSQPLSTLRANAIR